MSSTWYDRMCTQYDAILDWGRNRLAQAWDDHLWNPAKPGDSQLQKLLGDFHNFAKLLDLPADTKIRFASNRDIETACASFQICDGNTFERPFILVNPNMLKTCSPENYVDVATGVFLHEAGHILFTRLFFKNQPKEPTIRLLENLLEDSRSEDLVIKSAPGYRDFILAARQQLLVNDWFLPTIQNWDSCCDTDKIFFIIAAYIRAPHVLREAPEVVRNWKDIGDQCVFEVVNRIMPVELTDEMEVGRIASALFELLDNYSNKSIALLSQLPLDTVHEELLTRLRNQIDADAYDESIQKLALEDKLLQIRPGSIEDFRRLLSHMNTIKIGLDDATLERIQSLECKLSNTEVPNILPEQKMPERYRNNSVIVVRSEACSVNSKYQDAKRRMLPQIRRLRSSFPSDKRLGNRLNHGKSSGLLDHSRLWRSDFDQYLCATRKVDPTRRVTLAILLDASGSMEVDETYIRALETAVLLNEAFECHSHLDIRLFAHSTTVDDKCIVWDYGTGMNARHSLSSYRPQNANFDDHAIHAVAATLSHLSDTRRIMISISDGSPCVKFSTTVHYAGSGVHATKRSVEELRAMGWIVIGVEIGTHFAERIYGDRWLLKISDPSKLPDRIAEMTIKILRKALG